jgi:regulator of protease activity HflC (stomatin/prohibitin superfamily)
MQMQIWSTYGSSNGLVTMSGLRNTLGDMLALSGIKNVDRYFEPMTPEKEQQLIMQQQQQEQQNQQMSEAEALVQAEQYKADKQAEMNMLKLQIDAQKAIAVDDRERDKMDQDLLTDAAKILGEYGTKVDVETIKGQQKEPRYPQESPAQAVTGGRF